jgi:hypothetical protein
VNDMMESAKRLMVTGTLLCAPLSAFAARRSFQEMGIPWLGVFIGVMCLVLISSTARYVVVLVAVAIPIYLGIHFWGSSDLLATLFLGVMGGGIWYFLRRKRKSNVLPMSPREPRDE